MSVLNTCGVCGVLFEDWSTSSETLCPDCQEGWEEIK